MSGASWAICVAALVLVVIAWALLLWAEIARPFGADSEARTLDAVTGLTATATLLVVGRMTVLAIRRRRRPKAGEGPLN